MKLISAQYDTECELGRKIQALPSLVFATSQRQLITLQSSPTPGFRVTASHRRSTDHPSVDSYSGLPSHGVTTAAQLLTFSRLLLRASESRCHYRRSTDYPSVDSYSGLPSHGASNTAQLTTLQSTPTLGFRVTTPLCSIVPPLVICFATDHSSHSPYCPH